MMEQALFYSCSVVAVVSALIAITRVQPFIASLWMALAASMIAVLIGLNDAPIVGAAFFFIAAATTLAVMLMSIMMDDRERLRTKGRSIQFGKVFGSFAATYLIVVLALVLARTPKTNVGAAPGGEPIGQALASSYGMPLTLIGLLLLVVIVCSVTMGKRNV
jgi:NADH:ubiquinone oxidoreductase subunit 6 (subunit J)